MSAVVLARLIHIIFGAIWVGNAVFITFFLLPTIRAVQPAGGQVMQHITQVRRLPIYMMIVTWMTLLSGAWLSWNNMGTMGMEWFKVGSGRIFGMGAILAFIAAIVGMSVSSPAARKLGELGASIKSAGRAPSPEEQAQMQALGKRLGIGVTVVMVLVVGAIGAMSVARYVG